MGRRKLPRDEHGNIIRKDGTAVKDRKTAYLMRKAAKLCAPKLHGGKDFVAAVTPDLKKQMQSEPITPPKWNNAADDNVKRLRESVRAVSLLVDRVTKGERDENDELYKFPMGFNPAQAIAVYEAEAKALGIDMRHIADNRTEAEKAMDAAETLLQIPAEDLALRDEEITALEMAVDQSILLCTQKINEYVETARQTIKIKPNLSGGPGGGSPAEPAAAAVGVEVPPAPDSQTTGNGPEAGAELRDQRGADRLAESGTLRGEPSAPVDDLRGPDGHGGEVGGREAEPVGVPDRAAHGQDGGGPVGSP